MVIVWPLVGADHVTTSGIVCMVTGIVLARFVVAAVAVKLLLALPTAANKPETVAPVMVILAGKPVPE